MSEEEVTTEATTEAPAEPDPEDSALGMAVEKEPDPDVDPAGHQERLRQAELAAFEREYFMCQSKLETARVHQPGLVEQYETELANAQQQFTNAGGVLPAKAQKRKA